MRLFVRLSTQPGAKFRNTKEQNFFTNLTVSKDQEKRLPFVESNDPQRCLQMPPLNTSWPV